MNFRVIEGACEDFSSIYDDFEKDYLDTVLFNDEIRKKYNLSKNKFNRLCKLVKSNNGISKRPSAPRNYYKHNTGYYIMKKIDGKRRYLGHVPTVELAIKATALCRQLNWNPEACKLAIMEVKKCQ